MKSTLVLVTGLALLSLSSAIAQHQHGQDTQMQESRRSTKEIYSCPMHPEVVSDQPGKCPKCGMKLEKQANQGLRPRRGESSPSSMMGKPTFEQTVDGINLQVWLITQEEHKKMMKEHMSSLGEKGEMKSMDHGMMHGKGMMGMMHGKKEENTNEKDHHMMDEGMKHDGKEMSKETMEAMMAGTHHVMVMATDEVAQQEIANVKVAITVTTASNKSSTVDLVGMMDRFGGGVSLEEKGTYQLDPTVTVGKKTYTWQLSYEVK